MQTHTRFTLITPMAALATLGLFIGMKALIAGDFKPENKIAAAQFDINPLPDDIIAKPRVTKVAALKPIEIPPAPPEIEKQAPTLPSEPIVETDKTPSLDPDDIEFNPINILEDDKDARPIVRIAAVSPPRAQKSGHCKVRFDVSPEGQTYNIQPLFCSERLFERSTIKAVAKWRYSPKIRGGVAVSRSGVESVMRFNITDERGQIIPE